MIKLLLAMLLAAVLCAIRSTRNSFKANKELARARDQIKQIWGNSDVLMWSYDVKKRKLNRISPACEKVYGYPQEAFLRNPDLWQAAIHPEDAAAAGIETIIATSHDPISSTYRIYHADGEVKWLISRIYPEYDSAGKLQGLQGIVADITEQKAAEESRLKDLQLATLVQKSMLSVPLKTKAMDIDARYLPSDHLGGDMYAWYQLDEDRYGMIIMDVMGSGVTSSLICMSIRSLLEGIIRKCIEPETVVTELNAHMYRLYRKTDSPARFFFTALYAVVDTKKGCIEYVNAGHFPGFLLDASNHLQQLNSTCVPIGLMPELLPAKQTLTFINSARLVLYTDGLVESPGVHLQSRLDALKAALHSGMAWSIGAFIDHLIEMNQVEHVPHSDDVCVVCADFVRTTASQD